MIVRAAIVVLILGLIGAPAYADIDWTLEKELNLGVAPVDVAASLDGETIFILTPTEIVAYSVPNEQVVSRIPIAPGFDRISLSFKDNTLIVTNSSEQTMKIIKIEQIYDISVSGHPYKGQENAAITIAVFSDYQCAFCAKTAVILDQVLEDNSEHVKLVFKNYPLSIHKLAKKAAAAAIAADNQGKFWEFHSKLYENYKDLSDEKITAIAQELGLDMEKFENDLKDPVVEKAISEDMGEGRKIGIKGTPTVFINGKLARSRTRDSFQEMIDAELHEGEPATATKAEEP
jgi:protein-disulfide isomerase